MQSVANMPYTMPTVTSPITYGMGAIAAFAHVLERFNPISLAAMDSVALLKRTDTKYVMSESQLYQALLHLTEDYDVLDIKGCRLHRYQTLYFDTPDFALYRQHHNGWGNRYKLRSRTYLDSGLSFLEVKHKTNKGVTEKNRIRTSDMITRFDTFVGDFLQTCYLNAPQGLEPKLWNDFRRITLVSKHHTERLTLDVGLHFQWGTAHVALPGIAIAEVKQEGFSLRSDFVGQVRALGVRAMSFSKFCMGVSLLYDQVKSNHFKSQWLSIDRMMQKKGV